MIQTTLAHMERYLDVHPAFAKAFSGLRERTKEAFSAGSKPIDGENVFVNAFSYETRDLAESQMEAHQKYIDIMFLLSGEEEIAYCPVEKLETVTAPYHANTDALLAQLPQAFGRLTMQTGDVAIFFPEDAHCPGLVSAQKQRVEKLVVKVRV